MNSSLFGFSELMAVPINGKQMMRDATLTVSADVYHKKVLVAFTELILQKCLGYVKGVGELYYSILNLRNNY